eukprot:CAMPEP_0113549518 /NCGR_PEP_ID=MMETSP0015_2-20120614/13476_1 /TAXON_ID=2838 /ORGANISM="Odontella" /LENGTH=217 /DNA_ID=CAMNT_0000450233 /DNA_START=152 /DNA_END=802 /DNA_ORIENTATION=+ /assembly_acc=CAM_ASM_000160
MAEHGNSGTSRPDRSLQRSFGPAAGLSAVNIFSEPYPDEEESYTNYSDASSFTHMSLDLGLQNLTDSILTVESDSSSEAKFDKKSWIKAKASPWKELKKVKRELHVKNDQLVAERKARRDLEAQFAEMKLLVAKAKEQKDEYLAMIERANDEKVLTKVNAENDIMLLVERLKASEASRKELENRIDQMEGQSNRSERRSSRGSVVMRKGRDYASRKW